jgi:hypothetical protein
MSASHSKADIPGRSGSIRFGPIVLKKYSPALGPIFEEPLVRFPFGT